jgi:pyridoxine 4-dehydrogenase
MSASETLAIAGDRRVRRIGYGAMRLTGQPGNFGPYADWEGGKKLLRRAVDIGVNFFDTARAYGPGWNERLIAEALYPYPSDLVIATKGGVVKKSATERHLDGSAVGLQRDCEESLRNLRLDRIELYQLHWVDPNTPLEESLTGLAKLREQGKVRYIGLSNVTLDQLRLAVRLVPITSVQNRYSFSERNGDAIVDYCAGEGVVFLPYGPLGGDPFKPGSPLARDEGELAEIAKKHHLTAAQAALSWLLHRSPNIIAIPGTTSVAHLEENVAAANLQLNSVLQVDRPKKDLGRKEGL